MSAEQAGMIHYSIETKVQNKSHNLHLFAGMNHNLQNILRYSMQSQHLLSQGKLIFKMILVGYQCSLQMRILRTELEEI